MIVHRWRAGTCRALDLALTVRLFPFESLEFARNQNAVSGEAARDAARSQRLKDALQKEAMAGSPWVSSEGRHEYQTPLLAGSRDSGLTGKAVWMLS